MRDDYTRSQSQSKEDPDVAEGSPKFFYDNNSWIFPTTESEYHEGIERFKSYRERLVAGDPDTVFYARADNLREWLTTISSRLGSLSQRLSASVAKRRVNTDLAGEQNARQALEIADKGYVLVQGANAYTDTGAALLADPEVRKSFLGG